VAWNYVQGEEELMQFAVGTQTPWQAPLGLGAFLPPHPLSLGMMVCMVKRTNLAIQNMTDPCFGMRFDGPGDRHIETYAQSEEDSY
jgi:hypothetical protein